MGLGLRTAALLDHAGALAAEYHEPSASGEMKERTLSNLILVKCLGSNVQNCSDQHVLHRRTKVSNVISLALLLSSSTPAGLATTLANICTVSSKGVARA